MKRRAGVRTDRDLATYLGVAQSTVSHWRARHQVPESAVLRFERMAAAGGSSGATRIVAARMLAMRLAEFWYHRAKADGATGGREIFYSVVAAAFPAVCEALVDQIEKYEGHTGRNPTEIADHLIEDERFLSHMTDWLKELPVSALRKPSHPDNG